MNRPGAIRRRDAASRKGPRMDSKRSHKLSAWARGLVACFLCALIAMAFAVVPAFAASGTSAEESLVVGVPADRCPVFYADPATGEPTGIGVDLMRLAAENADYNPTFRFVAEPTLKDALDNADYDVVMPFGSAIESASGLASVVSDDLIKTPFTLVTVGDRDIPVLKSIRVGMLSSLGGGAETVKKLYPDIEITMYETMDECVKALRAGEVDALLHNSYVWSYVLQKPSYADLKVQPSAMFSMDFRAGAIGTPEGCARIERLNSGIAKLDDTHRQAIVLDYTTRRLYRYDVSDYLYQYGAAIALIALLVLAIIVIILQRRHAMRLEQEEKLRNLIDYDALTGALSLTGFRKRVEEVLRAHPDVPYILSYNNITNFKYINDRFGMQAGDELLRFWVDKSLPMLAEDEAMGRLEADHFAVFRRVEGEERIHRDEENVLNPLRNYFIDRGEGTRVQLCSGGYVLVSEDYLRPDVDHMLDCARVAERRLRETRKDGFEFYNPKQWEKGRLAADIVSHLPLALQSGEVEVWYQPQVNFDTGEIIGVEALCRWDHDKLGWLLPSEFIPVLEESGLIYDLDRFVWETVCQDLHRWSEQGKRLSASVNLARNDVLKDTNIPGRLYNLVQSHGLTPDQLRVEITETAYVEDSALLIATTMKLRELGFAVEMDDFGSGYSSLHMLKEVPVDRIKLDLNFLTGTGDPVKGRVIVSKMIELVSLLGMDLIAEGVETVEQASFLQERGCSEMQGYYFYKPMPVSDFEAVLKSGRCQKES